MRVSPVNLSLSQGTVIGNHREITEVICRNVRMFSVNQLQYVILLSFISEGAFLKSSMPLPLRFSGDIS